MEKLYVIIDDMGLPAVKDDIDGTLAKFRTHFLVQFVKEQEISCQIGYSSKNYLGGIPEAECIKIYSTNPQTAHKNVEDKIKDHYTALEIVSTATLPMVKKVLNIMGNPVKPEAVGKLLSQYGENKIPLHIALDVLVSAKRLTNTLEEIQTAHHLTSEELKNVLNSYVKDAQNYHAAFSEDASLKIYQPDNPVPIYQSLHIEDYLPGSSVRAALEKLNAKFGQMLDNTYRTRMSGEECVEYLANKILRIMEDKL